MTTTTQTTTNKKRSLSTAMKAIGITFGGLFVLMFIIGIFVPEPTPEERAQRTAADAATEERERLEEYRRMGREQRAREAKAREETARQQAEAQRVSAAKAREPIIAPAWFRVMGEQLQESGLVTEHDISGWGSTADYTVSSLLPGDARMVAEALCKQGSTALAEGIGTKRLDPNIRTWTVRVFLPTSGDRPAASCRIR